MCVCVCVCACARVHAGEIQLYDCGRPLSEPRDSPLWHKGTSSDIYWHFLYSLLHILSPPTLCSKQNIALAPEGVEGERGADEHPLTAPSARLGDLRTSQSGSAGRKIIIVHLVQSPRITQKKKKKKRPPPHNHVYERRFKPFWITSACLNLLYRSVWPALSPGPAWPHILSILIQLFAPIGQKAKGAD